jgi:hypothetical protein
MTSQVNVNTTIAGVTFAQNRSVASEAVIAQERTIPAAQAGSLTTRTSTSVGTITMSSGGHTITTGARVDLYWTEAGVKGCRRGVVVGTVAGTSVPITAGSGDNLPTNLTALTVALPITLLTAINGSKLVALFFGAPEAQTQFVMCSGASTEEYARNLGQGAVDYWDSGQLGVTNPIAGDTITLTFVSHGDATGAKRVQFCAQYNN